MMKISEQRKQAARQRFTVLANKLKEQDLKNVVAGSTKKMARLGDHVPESLTSIWSDIKVSASLVSSYVNGSYRKVPWRSLGAIGASLLYFVTPIDALPDMIPLAGYLDDAFIFKLVFDLVRQDLEDYKRWQNTELLDEL